MTTLPNPEEIFPILEYDPSRTAIIDPPKTRLFNRPVSDRAVLCFFLEVIEGLKNDGQLVEVGALGSEMGRNPVYQLEHSGQNLLVVHPGVGAPLAAGFLDELIAVGVRKFIACGGCGVLDRAIAVGYPVILTSAVRDEGTSYHYLPPSREVESSPEAVAALELACQQAGQPYRLGKTWTTDGLYRETPARRARRQAEGCLVVEMEAAAFFAVARFRAAILGQVVYGGDLVVPEGWDPRSWIDRGSDRQRLFWLAVEACQKL